MSKALKLLLKIIISLTTMLLMALGQTNPLMIGFNANQQVPFGLGIPFINIYFNEGLGFLPGGYTVNYNLLGIIGNILVFITLMFFVFKFINKLLI